MALSAGLNLVTANGIGSNSIPAWIDLGVVFAEYYTTYMYVKTTGNSMSVVITERQIFIDLLFMCSRHNLMCSRRN